MTTPEGSAALSDYWQEQINTWKQSGQSRKAFCHQHELNYHRFGYWYKKLNRDAQLENNSSSQFVPVKMTTQHHATSGVFIELPGGLCIKGITPGNLMVVERLLRQLR